MQYRVKIGKEHTKITFPFITLHMPQYSVDKVRSGMNSRDLFILDNEKTYCLGVCWFESLRELLKHTDCPVYVLEDVYLRFKGQFDTAFSLYRKKPERLYIITDRGIAYNEYIEEKLNQ